jgi:ABC-type transport system involved in cytochrome c biogenesis ATPase subunit
MLEYLHLRNVGPAPEIKLEPGPRTNLITGDNGLGKSFLLDTAWWALTRTWSGLLALPRPGPSSASISFRFRGSQVEDHADFDRGAQAWTEKPPGRAPNPVLVLYAQVDGSFRVWDPARNYWRRNGLVDVQERPPLYRFDPASIWDGVVSEGNVLCNGLIHDWVSWQKEGGEAFEQLKAVLAQLSSPAEKLVPGKPTRISLDDVRDIPTLQMPYGQEVPVLHASAGMKRIIALGYLLVWAWQEHQRASELLEQPVTRQIIFLIDEIEAHLHPKWQRVILGSLLKVREALASSADVQVQLLCVTHSPLLLASVEPLFDEEEDRLFHLDMVKDNEKETVVLSKVHWCKQGDTTSWLVSEVFGLRQARSLEAEGAIEAAEAFMRGDQEALPKGLVAREEIDVELKRVLAGNDPFWPRWIVYVEQRAGGRA